MVCSLPPISVLISGGNSDSTTMPTSQNQLVTNAPHHNLRSARKCRIIVTVEAAMLVSIFRCGAPSPVAGISKADIQHAIAKPMTSAANVAVSPPSRAASPPQSSPEESQRMSHPRSARWPAAIARVAHGPAKCRTLSAQKMRQGRQARITQRTGPATRIVRSREQPARRRRSRQISAVARLSPCHSDRPVRRRAQRGRNMEQ